MKDGRHQEGLLHLHLDLALDGEGGFGDGGIPVAQDHLFVEQEDGVGFLERSGRGQREVRERSGSNRPRQPSGLTVPAL